MGHYVYRYMHPDYPWLYVGKTDGDLAKRIKTHQTCSTDNIERKYLELLNESSIYYIELNSSVQTDYIEKMLIDKYKPLLNKKDKNGAACKIEITIPKWEKFNFQASQQYKTSTLSVGFVSEDVNYNRNSVMDIGSVDIHEVYDYFDKFPKSNIKFVSIMYDEFSRDTVFKISKTGIRILHQKKLAFKASLRSRDWITNYDLFSSITGYYPNDYLAYENLLEIYRDKLKSLKQSLQDKEIDADNIKFGDSFYCVNQDGIITNEVKFYGKDCVSIYDCDGLIYSSTLHTEDDKSECNSIISQFLIDSKGMKYYEHDDHVLNLPPIAKSVIRLNKVLSIIRDTSKLGES